VSTRIVSIRLPEEKLLRIRQRAARERKTITAVIEESLDAALADDAEASCSNLERMSYVIGACASGGGDVTTMDLGTILAEQHAEAGHL